jgi:hypothetical protein
MGIDALVLNRTEGSVLVALETTPLKKMRPSLYNLEASSSQSEQHLQHFLSLGQHNFQPQGQDQLSVVYPASLRNPSGSVAVQQEPQLLPNVEAVRTAQDECQPQHPSIALEYESGSPTIETEPSITDDGYRTQKTTTRTSIPMRGKKRSASREESNMTKGKKASGAGRSRSPGQYSKQVKKNLAASSRTNQACDRCKVCQDNSPVLPCTPPARISNG